MARAAIALTGPAVAAYALTPSRQALCLEALAMLDDDETELRGLVETQLMALASAWSTPVPPGERVSGDEAARRLVELQAEHAAATGPDGLGERLDVAGRIIQLGSAAFDDEITAWGRLWRLDVLVQLGRRVELDGELVEFAAVVARLGSAAWDWRLVSVKANLALLEDRLTDVPELVGEALQLGRDAGLDDAPWLGLTLRSAYARRTGDNLDAIEAEVRRALAGAPFFAQGWRAGLLISLDRIDEANAIWRSIAPHLDEMPKAAGEWILAMVDYAESAIVAEDTASATWLRGALQPYAHQHVSAGATTPYGGPVCLALGQLSAFLGDRPAAEHWLTQARRRAEAMNAPWFAARARETLAALGRRYGPLSPRESEVARLVATGESNREIAARLYLSERTVEQHVSSALRKLGLPSRAALTAWVVGSDSHRPVAAGTDGDDASRP